MKGKRRRKKRMRTGRVVGRTRRIILMKRLTREKRDMER